jgi:cyclic pyranopterin monophosphate synthase
MMEKTLSHLDELNNPAMVDVGNKTITLRQAVAQAVVVLNKDIVAQITNGELHTKKGAVIQTAIIAGTMAAKRTSDLIPLCHPLGLDSCKFTTDLKGLELYLYCTCKLTAKTGVEMEALTGATVAALTVYDMCKAMSHSISITNIKLLEKTGGKSDYSA